jgi:glycosyltransferase involved in cell wall biosynthesis
MKILLVCPKKISGVEYHRLIIPHASLEDEITAIQSIDHQPDEFFHNFDLIVTSRVVSKIGNQEILWNQLKRLGIPVVVDTDDHWIIPKSHPMYNNWAGKAEQIIYNLKNATHVTCTTNHLKALVLPYNKNVTIIPNSIDFNQPQWKEDLEIKGKKDSKVHIGWSGSVTHMQDILELSDTFLSMTSNPDLRGKYKLILSGYVDKDTIWKEYERIFTSGYRIDESQYSRINAMDVNTYAAAYDLMDIGLIPLRSNDFNKAKSELKMIEMGAKGLGVIVSNEYPYTNIINHKINCLAVNSKKEWYNAIKLLIDNPNLRKDLASNLHEQVKKDFNILKVNEIRINLYKNLISYGKA